jgi:hypothetical protein
MSMHDSSGRPIPAPPARFSPKSAFRPTRRPEFLTWAGDTRPEPGNLTARARRPLTAGDYRRLMAAPAGR